MPKTGLEQMESEMEMGPLLIPATPHNETPPGGVEPRNNPNEGPGPRAGASNPSEDTNNTIPRITRMMEVLIMEFLTMKESAQKEAEEAKASREELTTQLHETKTVLQKMAEEARGERKAATAQAEALKKEIEALRKQKNTPQWPGLLPLGGHARPPESFNI